MSSTKQPAPQCTTSHHQTCETGTVSGRGSWQPATRDGSLAGSDNPRLDRQAPRSPCKRTRLSSLSPANMVASAARVAPRGQPRKRCNTRSYAHSLYSKHRAVPLLISDDGQPHWPMTDRCPPTGDRFASLFPSQQCVLITWHWQ